MTRSRRSRAACAGAVLLILGSAAAHAQQTLRCSRGVVVIGDDELTVLDRCGEPDSRSFRSQEIVTTNRIGIRVTRVVDVETWAYRRGSGRFLQLLDMAGGELTRIRRGPRQD